MIKRLFLHSRKGLALFLSVTLLTHGFDALLPAVQAGSLLASRPGAALDLRSLEVPGKWGFVEDVRLFENSPYSVVILQDAHAFADAQEKLARLTRWFIEEKKVTLSTLEGASGTLDTRLLKSFPDKARLEEVLSGYLSAGEISGAAAASVLTSSEAHFEGLEDSRLYEDSVNAYLAAQAFKDASEKSLALFKHELEKISRPVLPANVLVLLASISEGSLTLTEQLEAFRRALPASFFEQFQYQYPHVYLLFSEMSKSREAELSIRRELSNLENNLRAVLKSGPLKALSGFRQQFETEMISAEVYAEKLLKLAESHAFEMEISENLKESLQVHQRLDSLKGLVLSREWESFRRAALRFLAAPEDARTERIFELWRYWELLLHWNRLELTAESWEELERGLSAPQEGEEFLDVEAGFQAFFDASGPEDPRRVFYRLAEERDHVFFARLKEELERGSHRSALFTAGGFHSRGLQKLLTEQGISHAVVTPAVREIPEENLYPAYMRGEISWKSYFKIHQGKADVYEAFQTSVTARLAEGLESDRGHFFSVFKLWRERLLGALAAEGSLDEAFSYTRFIDRALFARLSEENQKSLESDWQNVLEKFIQEIRRLKTESHLTANTVAQIPQAFKVVQWPAVMGFVKNATVPESWTRGRPKTQEGVGFSRPELRAENPEQDESDEEPAVVIFNDPLKMEWKIFWKSIPIAALAAFEVVRRHNPAQGWMDLLLSAFVLTGIYVIGIGSVLLTMERKELKNHMLRRMIPAPSYETRELGEGLYETYISVPELFRVEAGERMPIEKFVNTAFHALELIPSQIHSLWIGTEPFYQRGESTPNLEEILEAARNFDFGRRPDHAGPISIRLRIIHGPAERPELRARPEPLSLEESGRRFAALRENLQSFQFPRGASKADVIPQVRALNSQLYEALNGLVFKEGYQLHFLGLDYFVIKLPEARPVGNISLMFAFRDGQLEADIGANLIPEERGRGILSDFRSFLAEVLPENMPLSSEIDNVPTLYRLLETLEQETHESFFGQSMRSRLRELLENYEPDFQVNTTLESSLKWRKAARDLLREVYGRYPGLIPGPDVMSETQLGRLNRHYGEAVTSLRLRGGLLEFVAERSELRNSPQKEERFYSRLLDLASEEPVTSILEDSDFVTNRALNEKLQASIAVRYLDLFIWLVSEKGLVPEDLTGLSEEIGFKVLKKNEVYLVSGTEEKLILAENYQGFGPAQETEHPILLEWNLAEQMLSAVLISLDQTETRFLKIEILQKRPRRNIQPFNVNPLFSIQTRQPRLLLSEREEALPLRELVLRVSLVSNPRSPERAELRSESETEVSDDEFWPLFWNDPDHFTAVASGELGRGYYQHELKILFDELLEDLDSGARVLDIAAGKGAAALALMQAAGAGRKKIHVESIDAAASSIPLVLGESDAVFLQMPAEKLNYPENHFDAVTSFFGIEYSRLEESLSEAIRVLRPGGQAVFLLHSDESYLIADQLELAGAFPDVLNSGFISAARMIAQAEESEWKELWEKHFTNARTQAEALNLRPRPAREFRTVLERLQQSVTAGSAAERGGQFETVWAREMRRFRESYLAIMKAFSMTKARQFVRDAERAGFRETSIRPFYYRGEQLGWLFEAVKTPLEKEIKTAEAPRFENTPALPPRFLLHELGNLLTPLEAADSEIDPFGDPQKMEAVYGENFYRDYAAIKSRFQSTRNNFLSPDLPDQVSKLLLDYARFFSPENMRPHLERIRASGHPNASLAAERLEAGANWIYEMAKVYSGLEEEQIKTIRLSLLARDASAGLGDDVRYQGGWHEENLTLRTYPLELYRVMRNLVINAVHATDPAITQRDRNVIVTLQELNPEVNEGFSSRIDVRDNGTGIAPEVLPRIFEPFFTTKGDRGTGVGLSMVRQSVEEKLGGKLEVETRVGEGSVFSIYLPETPEARSELRQVDPENPDDLTRREFLSAGGAASMTVLFGSLEESSGQEPKRAGAARKLVLPQNSFLRNMLFRELYGDTQSGLSQMLSPSGLPYNQAPSAARPASGWMKSADPGFLWMTDVLSALNHGTLPLGPRGSYSDPRAVTARIKKSLALYKKTVETFGLKIDGVNTGIIPEILIYEQTGFRTELTTLPGTDDEKGVAYAAYDMALTHLRLKVLAEIFRGGYVRGLEDAELVKTAEELLRQADYRVFLDGEKNIRMQVFEKTKGGGVVQSPALIDNRHTEARGFFLIAELFAKPQGDQKTRRAEGLKALAKLKQEWIRLPARGGEFVPVGKGDANLTAWTEYEGLQFLDAAEISPGALRKSSQNYFKAAEEVARQKGYTFAVTAPGTGERPQVYEAYGLKKPEVTVPAGVFLALLSDLPEAVQNAEKFLREAKRQRGYTPGWGLADSYDPKTAKPFHAKRIFMNQALILESLSAPLLRYVVSQWEDYPELRENFKAFERAHPAPETLKESNVLKMFTEMGTFTQIEHYPDNKEEMSVRGVLKLNYRVDEKNNFSGFYGRIREQDLGQFKSLRLKFSKTSRLPERFRLEFKGAAPERKILGTVETPVLKAGETYTLDISKLTSEPGKVSEIVIVFEREKAGKNAAGSLELEEMILSPAEVPPARQELRFLPQEAGQEELLLAAVRPALESLAAGRALESPFAAALSEAAAREILTVERLFRAEAQDPSYALFWSQRAEMPVLEGAGTAAGRELFLQQLLADFEDGIRIDLTENPQKKRVFAFGYRLPASEKARANLLDYLERLSRIRGAFPGQVTVDIRLMVLPHELQQPDVRGFFRETGRLGVAKAVEMTSASVTASLEPYLDDFPHALVYGLSDAGLLAGHPYRAVLSDVEPGEDLPVVVTLSRLLSEEDRLEITAERLGKLAEFLPGILQIRGGMLAITRLALEIAERFQTAQLIGRAA